MEVSIGSNLPQGQAQAPSIISVVTRQDIETFGFRDAADILRMIPGFEFGVDPAGQVGAGFRGVWVHEGKVLWMINGQPVNDLGYGSFELLGSIPASMVERVEVIRGPGSALYGSFAEAAVINFITRKPTGNRLQLNAMGGLVGPRDFSRDLNASFNQSFSEDMEVWLNVGYAANPLSGRTYYDFFGGSLQLGEDNSPRSWTHVLAEGRYKGLTLSYLRTSFRFQGQDGIGPVIPPVNGLNTVASRQEPEAVNVQYQWDVNDKLRITPRFNLRTDGTLESVLPTLGLGFEEFVGHSRARRILAELSAQYDVSGAGRATLGVGYIRDDLFAISNLGSPGIQRSEDPADVDYDVFTRSVYGMAEYTQQLGPVGATVGGRYENTTFGNAFAPRAGLTLVGRKFHVKALYGRAFRVPLPFQAFSRGFLYSGGLKPESSNTVDVEVGYTFSSTLSARVNAFFLDIRSPILFAPDGVTNVASYQNYDRIQSYGAEGELLARFRSFGGFLNFSYARPGSSTEALFTAPDGNAPLGLPTMKANVGAYWQWRKLNIGPSLTLLSSRQAPSPEFALGTLLGEPELAFTTQKYPALALVNLNVRVLEVLPGLTVNAAAYNLFNAPYVVLQPYQGVHSPLPAHDREFRLGLQYKM
ncbi:MAG TPA: TonB-dependent receptor plug domain-containing protein [Myxococcaceae bacterium]|nr:TonB-dependent receptor plug domain-containing protein [Myxococcaceae bacterium]